MLPLRSATLSSLLEQSGKGALQFPWALHALIFGTTRSEGSLQDIQGLDRLQVPTPLQLWSW